jgi:hypothetical protein
MWAGVIFTVITVLTFAKVWQATFEYYNVPAILLFIGIPLGYLMLCVFIGYWDERTGLFRKEQEHYNDTVNPQWPQWLKLLDDVEKIKAKLEIEE